MRRLTLLGPALTCALLVLGAFVNPAAAARPPLPSGCTFSGGYTTCMSTSRSDTFYEEDDCVTESGEPGTQTTRYDEYEVYREVYKGYGTRGRVVFSDVVDGYSERTVGECVPNEPA